MWERWHHFLFSRNGATDIQSNMHLPVRQNPNLLTIVMKKVEQTSVFLLFLLDGRLSFDVCFSLCWDGLKYFLDTVNMQFSFDELQESMKQTYTNGVVYFYILK